MTQNNKIVHTVEYYDKEKTIKNYEEYSLKGKLHKEDGPAYIYYHKNGSIWSKHYCINGGLHREDGPALIRYYKDGSIWDEYYYLNGVEYSKEEYLNLISPQNRIKVLLNDT